LDARVRTGGAGGTRDHLGVDTDEQMTGCISFPDPGPPLTPRINRMYPYGISRRCRTHPGLQRLPISADAGGIFLVGFTDATQNLIPVEGSTSADGVYTNGNGTGLLPAVGVGDPYQSIYAFRGAKPGGMTAAVQRAIRHLPTPLQAQQIVIAGQKVVLSRQPYWSQL
jgi:hypothetical protein